MKQNSGMALFWAKLVSLMALLSWPSLTLALCPMKCTCHEKKLIVNCKKASLDVVPITLNPELKELYLSHNQIKSITASFTFYQNLEFLDLSHNSLTIVGRKNLAAQQKLRVLFLNQNKINEISNHSFYGLSSLQLLNLNDNRLRVLPNRIFAGLNRLEKLDLSRNRLSTISPEAFSGLINLKTLLLRDNKLSGVPTVPFYHLPNLVKLDLSLNALGPLAEFAFSPLSTLEDLSLDSSRIKSIHSGALRNLNQLRRLSLEENELQEIPSDTLEQVKNLEELIIGKNEIHVIRGFAFRGTPKLKTFEFRSDHQLAAIEVDAFHGIPHLTKLTLEFCPGLKVIHEETFSGQKKSLRVVSLRGNHLSYLSPTLLNWEQLQFIDVRSNPLSCNCSLLWLWELLKARNFSNNNKQYRDELVCHDPPNLRGHDFLSLSLSEMACYQGRHSLITGSLIVATVCALLSILLSLWCKTRFYLFIRQTKYQPDLIKEDIGYYEKGRIIVDNQVMFPPSTMVLIQQSPMKTTTISQV